MKRFFWGSLLVLTFAGVGIAAAPPLTFTFKDVHATKTATETDSYAVNNSSTIAGDYVDAKGTQHAMLHGVPTTTVDNNKCQAITGTGGIAFYGINKTCSTAGWCTNSDGIDIGFTWTKGKFVDINFPKGTGTQPTGINDKGDVVGLYFDSVGNQHGFLKKAGGKYQSIDVPGETSAVAWAINNAGDITVYAVNSSGDFDAFLYNGKTFKNINDPNAKGTVGTVVHTINNKGDIDGTYYDSAGNTHGWLLHAGKYYDVNDPKGPDLSRADGLNDKLEIVGRYTPSSGGNVGFRATTAQ